MLLDFFAHWRQLAVWFQLRVVWIGQIATNRYTSVFGHGSQQRKSINNNKKYLKLSKYTSKNPSQTAPNFPLPHSRQCQPGLSPYKLAQQHIRLYKSLQIMQEQQYSTYSSSRRSLIISLCWDFIYTRGWLFGGCGLQKGGNFLGNCRFFMLSSLFLLTYTKIFNYFPNPPQPKIYTNLAQYHIYIEREHFIMHQITVLQYNYNFIQSTMQQQYKTEHLIAKTNYRKHKQKLNQIKNNTHNTSLQFYGSGISKPLDRKKILMLKMKREEIQQENQHLRRKIEKINGNATQDGWRRKIVSESQQRKGSNSMANQLAEARKHRYAQDDGDRIEVTSDCGDGENIKYVIPSNRLRVRYSSTSHSKASDYNAIMFNLREKQRRQETKMPSLDPLKIQEIKVKQNPEGPMEGRSRILQQKHPSIPVLQSNPKLKQLIRQSTALNREDLLYNQPQKQAHRIVLFKKTKIPWPMVSFLIQISLIEKQLLIIAYGMGIITQDYRLVVSRKRSKELLEEFRNNFDSLWERIIVDPVDGIRISGFVDEQQNNNKMIADNQLPEIQKQKIRQQKRHQITQDFLQRNYYTLLKQSIKQKQQDPQVNPHQINKISYTKPQQSSLNNSATKPKSLFRNKIEYHRERADSNGNIVGIEKKQNKVVSIKAEVKDNRSKDKAVRDVKITQKSENKSDLNNKSSHHMKTKSEKKITNKSQFEQQYQEQFGEEKKEYQEDYEEQIQQIQSKNQSKIKSQRQSNNNISKKLPNKSQKLSIEDEYQENFEEDINKEPEEYSMQYQSNPSKVLNNKSSINAVKKKTINNQINNISQVSGVESLIEEDVDDIEENKSKNMNGKSKNIEKKSKKQDIDEEYLQEFQS